ncbi:MAG TPA: rod shape-determining protein RodA [Actinomycetota bacterium]|nr:rod shape-determining protein RodA [Actinomycetota bacterium]
MDATAGRRVAWERRAFRNIDTVLLVVMGLLTIYGMLMVYSATNRSLVTLGEDPAFYLKKQLTFGLLGLVILVVSATVDYRLFKVYAPIAYVAVLGALLAVMVPHIGTRVSGAQRWITLLGFQFQPSELTKVILILMLAAFLSEVKGGLTLRDVLRAAGIAALPMALVFLQPDVGTSMAFAAILVALLLVARARARQLGILALIAVVSLFLGLQSGLVKDYQLARIGGFLDPDSDPQRAGYNRQQSEIAIGNGGLTGQGYLHGSQTNLDFVPAQHTDFIFTAIGEELGFSGAMVLLLLFGVLLWRGFRIALAAKDPFGFYVATAIVAMFAFQVFVNVGMTVGIMPITGIPLPFVSYGGTALMTNYLAVGLLLNIHMRRFK